MNGAKNKSLFFWVLFIARFSKTSSYRHNQILALPAIYLFIYSFLLLGEIIRKLPLIIHVIRPCLSPSPSKIQIISSLSQPFGSHTYLLTYLLTIMYLSGLIAIADSPIFPLAYYIYNYNLPIDRSIDLHPSTLHLQTHDLSGPSSYHTLITCQSP